MADPTESIIHVNGSVNNIVVCYSTNVANNGVWQGENPLTLSLPLFIMQLTVIMLSIRLLLSLLRPLHQPRIVAEILGGLLLGPSVLGKFKPFSKRIFAFRSLMVLETMSNWGLVYFLFLAGLEMDLSRILRTGKKAASIAAAGIIFPFAIGSGLFYLLQHDSHNLIHRGSVFWGFALSVTGFPVLARILAELKLLHTDLGRKAMSSAIINDICSWVFLALAIALSSNISTAPWAALSTIAFILFCVYAIRPAISWIIRRTPEGESFSEFSICLILTGVIICGFITDACGTHAITGAFMFGLVIPNGVLGAVLVERIEDFVSEILMPLYFTVTGLRTNIDTITSDTSWALVGLIIGLACAAKVVATVFASFFYGMPLREGMGLGVLMNTKGLLALIILNVGLERMILNDQTYSAMVVAIAVMTGMVTPIITAIYRPTRRFMQYKRRSIQRSKLDAELRILACIHSLRNVPAIISLLEASNATKRSPICVFALHLIELTGRASAMLTVHSTGKSGLQNPTRAQAHSDHIITAFENFEQKCAAVSVQPLTAMSPYDTMHEDICSLAEDKRVALIIIPFHKQQTIDGGMEDTNPSFRTINHNVLANAPCSVGLFIDRGLGMAALMESDNSMRCIAMLFFGGPDDREALSYAWRMSGHPSVSLTVVRFLPGDDVAELEPVDLPGDNNGILNVITDNEREKQLDDDFVNEFRLKSASDELILYSEKVLNNGEETVAAIRTMDHSYHLYIVGRGQGVISPLTAGLSDWSDCPELGAIGDLLATSEFAVTVSVLVMQQYAGVGPGRDGLGAPDSPAQQTEQFNNFGHSSDGFEPFVNHRGKVNGY